MAIELQVALSATDISVLGTLEARVRLRNTGPLPVEIPGEADRTTALTFDVYRKGTTTLIRRMNGFSHQVLMSGARIDPTHELEVVPAGGVLDFTLDLCQFHQPLPAGELEVVATYDYPLGGVHATTGRLPLRVVDEPVLQVSASRDNPVLDGLTQLFETGDGSTWGRQHNHARPLAAWWNRKLELPPGTKNAFCATASYFQRDSFDPAFEKWIVFVHGAYVVARRFRWGKPTGEQRAAPLPGRGRLCRSAFHNLTGELYVFFHADGLLEAYRLDAAALVKVFERALPAGVGEPTISADEQFVHIVYPHRGLVHLKVGIGQQPTSEDRIHKTGLLPLSWGYDRSARRVKAAFVDGPFGRVVELVTAGPAGLQVERRYLPVRGRLTELAFDIGRAGPCILYSTSRRRLYLSVGERSPALVATGLPRFFPYVVADSPVWVGHALPGRGYLFRGYAFRRGQPRFVDYETAAWEKA